MTTSTAAALDYSSMVHLFRDVCRKRAGQVAYLHKQDGAWKSVIWTQQEIVVRRLAKALMAIGVEKGDRVGILSQTRLEWVQADFGVILAGAATLGVYPQSLGPEVQFLLAHCGVKVLFVENAEQLQKVQKVRGETRVETIVLMEGRGDAAQGVIAWQDFLARGESVTDADLEQRGDGVGPDDLAALVATSGTTGQPKVATITHENLVFTSWSVAQSLPMRNDDKTLLFLPLAHVFARITAHCCVRLGVAVAIAESIQKVAENLREVRPTFIASVPRIFEKVHERIITNAHQAGGLKEKIFNWAVSVGIEVSRLQQKRKSVPPSLAVKRALADKLVFHKIREALGGQLLWAISGAAPLNATIAEFFHACGVLILEGLGMTENTSFSNVNRIEGYRFGTVGPVGPGIEMRLAEDGEVLFRGRNVMRGYYENPEATAEALDAEGWLHTGDIGEIDPDGHLRITDRKKDLIITAGGKNVAPQRIERILRESPYVNQVVAFGDKRKYIAALVTLNPETLEPWAKERGLPHAVTDLARSPEVFALIDAEIARANEQLASFEQVKKFALLPRDLTIDDGELTPTLKIKRKVVSTRYAEVIEALYATGGPEGERDARAHHATSPRRPEAGA